MTPTSSSTHKRLQRFFEIAVDQIVERLKRVDSGESRPPPRNLQRRPPALVASKLEAPMARTLPAFTSRAESLQSFILGRRWDRPRGPGKDRCNRSEAASVSLRRLR